jgi:NADH dehydrogenase FAD-containing subunit
MIRRQRKLIRERSCCPHRISVFLPLVLGLCSLVHMNVVVNAITNQSFRPSSASSVTLHHSALRRVFSVKMSFRPKTIRTSVSLSENSSNTDHQKRRHLVLVGGGHAHVQVIKALNYVSRPNNVDVTLIDMSATPSYSGMVPGAVAGLYRPDETLIHLKPLAEWAQIDFIEGRVVDIDVEGKVVRLVPSSSPGGPTSGSNIHVDGDDTTDVPFDGISIDIGSASRGVERIPGVGEFCIPTRPISALVKRIEDETEILLRKFSIDSQKDPLHIVIVGGGPAGIELSMSIMGRWQAIVGTSNMQVTLLDSGSELLPNETSMNRQALVTLLSERGINILHGVTVDAVEEESIHLASGEQLSYTHCLWATGAAAHPLASSLRSRGVAVSDQGWIRVNEYMQSISHPHLFAAGDCCTMEIPAGPPPKAGVYAVRAGPILIENLTGFLSEQERKKGANEITRETSSLKPYVPQDDFLKLLICGDGKAIGFRFGIPIYGKWVFQLKDAIDRSFMKLFMEKNLPTLVPGEQKYDTSQYDAAGERPMPINPADAAELLQRTDDDVDYEQGWNVLRDMAQDGKYRDAVLVHIKAFVPNGVV